MRVQHHHLCGHQMATAHCKKQHLPFTGPFPLYLLNHFWVLLHDVQEPITLLGQGSGPLLGAAGQLLEEIRDNVVQTGTAARANHGVYEDKKKGREWDKTSISLHETQLGKTPGPSLTSPSPPGQSSSPLRPTQVAQIYPKPASSSQVDTLMILQCPSPQ